MDNCALEGVRIADFSWVLAGPICTKHLAVMGAEVIKIETRRRPDVMRTAGQLDAEGKPRLNTSAGFNTVNHSKKSCTLDLTHPKGVELAKRIVRISDVVIENFAYGVMERLGLGYSSLRELKPDIIMISSSGMGRTGPYKEYVAYGNNLHAFSGLTALTGYSGGPPRGIGGTYSDPLTAMTLAFAVLTALHYRTRTGKGQYLDVSMTEATIIPLAKPIMDYIMNGRVSGPRGNQDDIMAPHNCYRCKGDDKWIAIAISTEEEWERFCHAIGSPKWCQEERFADAVDRYENQDELDKLIEEWTINHASSEVMETLQNAGVPAAPSFNTEELVNDPHLKERGFLIEIDHPEMGKHPVPSLPWKLSPGCSLNYKHAPLLGEHNEYVFHELLGMPKSEVTRLVEERVIW